MDINDQPQRTELLLLVYLHGFKGDDETFIKFPDRLNHIVQETVSSNTKVESVLFPAYETKGDLVVAVDRFVDWLATLVIAKESALGSNKKAKVVLCGHSMGGLLAADAILSIGNSRPNATDLLWPRIIGLVSFDTPYLGLHPSVFKNTLEKASSHAQTARNLASTIGVVAPAIFSYAWGGASSKDKAATPQPPHVEKEYSDPFADDNDIAGGDSHFQTRRASSAAGLGGKRAEDILPADNQPTPKLATAGSSWTRYSTTALYGLGAAAVAAGAAGAYNLSGKGLGWAQDHMKYVGNLWDGPQMKARLEGIQKMVDTEGLVFRNFYTQLPQTKGNFLPRTFCVLPQPGAVTRNLWVSAKNNIAQDEIQAHTEMFAPLSNDNYYDLGLRSAESVALSVSQSLRRDAEYRGEPEDSRTKARRSSFASTPNLGGNRLSTGSIGSASGSRRKSAVEQDVEKSLHIGQFGVAADEEWERRKQSGELGDIEEVHTPTGESDEESLRREKQFSSFAFGGSVTRESEELKRSMSPDRNRGNGGASSKPTLERLVSV